MRFSRLLLALALMATLAFAVAACGGDDDSSGTSSSSQSGSSGGDVSGEIAGAGASSQGSAEEAWIAGFQNKYPDATVSYDPVGSGGGREQFVAGGTAYAGSDAALADDELKGAQDRCGGVDNLIEIPVYVSPIAVIYNLDGVDNLQLSPDTAAKIFKQEITNWDDPAIKADNPDAQLPDQRITVVNRSDESGTTENFQDWLSQTAPSVWSFEVSGNWPVKGGEAAEGTSGVVQAVGAGKGAIGYADASQAGDLGVAKVKVGDQYVAPSPDGAAKVVDASPEADDQGRHVYTYKLDRKIDDPSAYPVVLVSYGIACTKYDDAKQASLVKAFLGYVGSDEGQQAAAQAAGSAPLASGVATKVQSAIAAIGSA
jgi:phosphate transport system substrate-binding protein